MFQDKMTITKHIWWIVLITGITSVLFGMLALFWPALTLVTLVYLFALFMVVEGAIMLFEALSSIRREPLWWLMLIVAAFNIGLGVYLLRNPLVAAAVFVALLAIFMVLQSVMDFAIAASAGKGEGRWMWIISGVFGLAMAVLVLVYPAAASLAFVWVLGLYTLVHGIVAVAYAAQTRRLIKK